MVVCKIVVYCVIIKELRLNKTIIMYSEKDIETLMNEINYFKNQNDLLTSKNKELAAQISFMRSSAEIETVEVDKDIAKSMNKFFKNIKPNKPTKKRF